MTVDPLPKGPAGVYRYYRDGGTRGDLSVYFRRGQQGIMRPGRAFVNADAAWRAGRDTAKAERS